MTTIKVPRTAPGQNTPRSVKARPSRKRDPESPDGDEFILAEIDDFNREIELTQQNKQLMRLLESRARQKGTVSLEEAKRQLDLG